MGAPLVVQIQFEAGRVAELLPGFAHFAPFLAHQSCPELQTLKLAELLIPDGRSVLTS